MKNKIVQLLIGVVALTAVTGQRYRQGHLQSDYLSEEHP